jgi:hypothetical protein
MTKLFRSTDAAEIFALEHRFPFAATLFSLFVAGNVGSAIFMLIAQAVGATPRTGGSKARRRK